MTPWSDEGKFYGFPIHFLVAFRRNRETAVRYMLSGDPLFTRSADRSRTVSFRIRMPARMLGMEGDGGMTLPARLEWLWDQDSAQQIPMLQDKFLPSGIGSSLAVSGTSDKGGTEVDYSGGNALPSGRFIGFSNHHEIYRVVSSSGSKSVVSPPLQRDVSGARLLTSPNFVFQMVSPPDIEARPRSGEIDKEVVLHGVK